MSSKIDWSNQTEANQYGFLKILVPAFAVGAILGPKGKKIAFLQEETETKVEMSRNNDYYPGTTERICLISGYKEAIFRILHCIMQAVDEKSLIDPTPCIDYDRKVIYGRGKQVKILIPNKIASKIIGSSGKTIKEIKLKSGSYVQLSQISSSIMIFERCITVMGEMENNLMACRLILDIIVSDRSMERFLHVSYADITHCIPNSNPVGSPIVENRNIPVGTDAKNMFPSLTSINTSMRPAFSSINAPLPPNNLFSQDSYSIPPPISMNALPMNVNQFLETLEVVLASSRLSDEAIRRIKDALSTLSNYGVLELCLQILLKHAPVMYGSTPVGITNFDPTIHPFSSPSTDINNERMFSQFQDMHLTDPNIVGPSSRLQNIFQPVFDLPEFGMNEASCYASTCSSFLERPEVVKPSFRAPHDLQEVHSFDSFTSDLAMSSLKNRF